MSESEHAAPELPEPDIHTGILGGEFVPIEDYRALLDSYERVVELHRMQLTAIDVLALCNTHESAEKQRIDRENPYWTTALQSVYVAVDREIKERERAEAAEARVKELETALAVSHGVEDFWQDKATALEAALAALRERDEKNARRYRWLRSKANRSLMTSKKWAGQIQVVQWEDKTTCNVLKTEALDDAIDAALSRDGEGSPPDAGSKA